MLTTAEGRSPVVPTQPNPVSRTVQRNRAAFVEAFCRFIEHDEHRIETPISVKVLAEVLRGDKPLPGEEDKRSYYAPGTVRWAAGSAGKYLKGTKDEVWSRLCHESLDYFALPPDEVLHRSNFYQRNFGQDAERPQPSVYDLEDFADYTDRQLTKFLGDNHEELDFSIAAAAVLSARHADKLRSANDITASGRILANTSEKVIERIKRAKPQRVSRFSAKTCVRIFQASADAYRVMSRDPRHEGAYIGQLALLLERAQPIIRPVQTPCDRILHRFYLESAQALIRHPGEPDATVRAQIDALTTAIATLSQRKVLLPGPAVEALAVRLASYALAYPDHVSELTTLRNQLHRCIPYYPASSGVPDHVRREVGQLRSDVALLLRLSGVPRRRARGIVDPSHLAMMTRYRGVGDLLIADNLLAVANENQPNCSFHLGRGMIVDNLDPYFGPRATPPSSVDDAEDHATQVERAPIRDDLRRTACGYYARGADWFRALGAAGLLKVRCEAGRDNLIARGFDPSLGTPNTARFEGPLNQLADSVERVIAETIIDVGTERGALKSVIPRHGHLIYAISHSAAVLQDPVAARSIRSDLSPAVFGATHPNVPKPPAT